MSAAVCRSCASTPTASPARLAAWCRWPVAPCGWMKKTASAPALTACPGFWTTCAPKASWAALLRPPTPSCNSATTPASGAMTTSCAPSPCVATTCPATSWWAKRRLPASTPCRSAPAVWHRLRTTRPWPRPPCKAASAAHPLAVSSPSSARSCKAMQSRPAPHQGRAPAMCWSSFHPQAMPPPTSAPATCWCASTWLCKRWPAQALLLRPAASAPRRAGCFSRSSALTARPSAPPTRWGWAASAWCR